MGSRFNPPPGWPTPSPGWSRPPGWRPNPQWPAPRPGWQMWISEHPQTPLEPVSGHEGVDVGDRFAPRDLFHSNVNLFQGHAARRRRPAPLGPQSVAQRASDLASGHSAEEAVRVLDRRPYRSGRSSCLCGWCRVVHAGDETLASEPLEAMSTTSWPRLARNPGRPDQTRPRGERETVDPHERKLGEAARSCKGQAAPHHDGSGDEARIEAAAPASWPAVSATTASEPDPTPVRERHLSSSAARTTPSPATDALWLPGSTAPRRRRHGGTVTPGRYLLQHAPQPAGPSRPNQGWSMTAPEMTPQTVVWWKTSLALVDIPRRHTIGWCDTAGTPRHDHHRQSPSPAGPPHHRDRARRGTRHDLPHPTKTRNGRWAGRSAHPGSAAPRCRPPGPDAQPHHRVRCQSSRRCGRHAPRKRH